MDIKIVFDSKSISNGFSVGWGTSFLIDNRILFDTGEKSAYLFNNMRRMDINLSNIETVVISHEHWDHTKGLWDILRKRKGLRVYACPHFSQEFKDKVKKLQGELVEASKFVEVTKNFFVTGEIAGNYKGQSMPEQALVAKTEKGINVITGCSHPGIVRILELVKEKFPNESFYLVFGGFHLKDGERRLIEATIKKFHEMKVKKVGPTHCSGREAEEMFKEGYKDNYISIKVGLTIEV